MAAFEVIALDTATPQLRAPGASDTYTFPRAVEMPLGTANGVLYLDGSKVVTSGSALTFDGTKLLASAGASTTGEFKTTSSTAQVFSLVASNDAGTSIGLGVFGSAAGTFGTLTAGNPFLSTAADRLVQNVQNASGAFIWGIGSTPTEQMRLNSTGLGIGTNNPGYKLDVQAATAVAQVKSTTGTNAVYYIASNTGGDFYIGRENSAGTTFGTTAYSSVLWSAGAYPMAFFTNGSERMRLDSSGNLGLGGSASRATTVGTAALNIFNGTAPAGTLANGISIYSSGGEAYVMDAAGNATLFSPHDAETNEWIFRSKHTPTGKVLKIDVERLLKFVNDHFGLDAVHEFVEV